LLEKQCNNNSPFSRLNALSKEKCRCYVSLLVRKKRTGFVRVTINASVYIHFEIFLFTIKRTLRAGIVLPLRSTVKGKEKIRENRVRLQFSNRLS
jgi:hypothetical protein